jgi:flagellar hook-basal body complex protein FliE
MDRSPLNIPRSASPLDPNGPAAAPRPTASAPPETPFSEMLKQMAQRIDSGEKAIERAIHAPAATSSAELLALQTQVYRYSETLDLAAKVVDKVSSSIKTVMQGQ